MPILPVAESIPATPRARIVKLDLQGQPFNYRAGQAAYLQPQGADKRRPYSIASAPEETDRHGLIEFLVQTGTNGVSGIAPDLLEPGTPVSVEGPLGSFTFPEHPRERRFVFIAGGTGIAPLRSMLWHCLLAARDGQVALVYSVRLPEEFAYLDQFEALQNEGRIEFRHTVTRGTGEGWTGRYGRIDLDCLKELVVPNDTLCFVCGPPALVGEIPLQLKQLGIADEQIRVEQWS